LRDLESTITLAFFLPGVVYMADAVGTQTEAVVIRGRSVGVPIGLVVHRELVTGLAVGVVIAAAFLLVGVALWANADVVIAVTVALFAACSTATLVAMALPWLFNRLGADPAFGSGPLATVVQDLLSLLIYFAVATVVVS
jgi:magnesium transporter